MARKIRFLLLTLSFLLFNAALRSQSKSALEDQGYDYLNNQDFENAYRVFDKLHTKYPREIDYQFKLGISALNFSEKKERSIEIFQDMKKKYKTIEVEFYLGKAYHRNYKFDEAIIVLQPLVDILGNSKKKEDKAMLPEVQLLIKNCLNGKFLMENKVFADISNIGGPINTAELEGVPVITADESMMIFTYVGRNSMGGKQNAQMKYDPNGVYLSDIYISYKDSATGQWQPAQAIEALNTRGNDAAIGMSPDGRTLFTFLSNNENEGDILMSQLNGSVFSTAVPLNTNINTPEYWEGSCSISADGKYLYFSSERPGGLGGRDIWLSEFVDGDWGPAVNLGPKINTEYDDDAPFIHPDGLTLFFSSKGHTSIGGYDIMFSIKQGNEWTDPRSMGIPLNTTEDDSYYVINSKGDKGFFSSTRAGVSAKGSQDIYMVTPGILGEKPIVALIKGTVYGDDKPLEAKIDVVKKSDGENAGSYFSNASTGKYLTALKPGNVYNIRISAEGYEPIEEDLDLKNLDQFIEQSKDFYLFSRAYITSGKDTARKSVPLSAAVAAKQQKEKETVAVNEPVKPAETKEETKPEEPVAAVAEEKKPEEKVEEPVAVVPEEKKEEKTEEPVAVKEEPKKETPKEEEPVVAVNPCDADLRDLSDLKGKSLNDKNNYAKLLKIAGNYCGENLVFKVQIGAFKKPENFKYEKLESLGKVESVVYPDGITRFTQKEFNMLKDAEKQRQKLISEGVKDAWIVAFVGSQRYTLEDFVNVNFLSGPAN